MNRDDLRANERLLASDKCHVHKGALAFSGKIFLTDQRLVFFPQSQIDRWAGAEQFEIELSEILMLDLRGFRKKMYIVIESQEFRFSGDGALRIHEKLHSIHHAFSLGNSVHSLNEIREIIYHQGSITVQHTGIEAQTEARKPHRSIELLPAQFFLSQKELRISFGSEEDPSENNTLAPITNESDDCILPIEFLQHIFFERGALHLEKQNTHFILMGPNAPKLFLLLLAHQEGNLLYSQDLSEITVGQGLRQTKFLWYFTQTFFHLVTNNNRNNKSFKISKDEVYAYHFNDSVLTLRQKDEVLSLNTTTSPLFREHLEQFILSPPSPSTKKRPVLDTPLEIWAIETQKDDVRKEENRDASFYELIPTKIIFNHSRIVLFQQGVKTSFGILFLDLQLHANNHFSIKKFSSRIHFFCHERFYAELRRFYLLLSRKNEEGLFWGARFPLRPITFNCLQEEEAAPNKNQVVSCSEIKLQGTAKNIEVSPMSSLGWKVSDPVQINAHSIVEATFNTANGILFLRSKIKRQKLIDQPRKSSWIVPYPIIIYRLNRRTYFRYREQNVLMKTKVILFKKNHDFLINNLSHQGLGLSKHLEESQKELFEQLQRENLETITIEIFDQCWEASIQWSHLKQNTKIKEDHSLVLTLGLKVIFTQQHQKLDWVKKLYHHLS